MQNNKQQQRQNQQFKRKKKIRIRQKVPQNGPTFHVLVSFLSVALHVIVTYRFVCSEDKKIAIKIA